MAHITMRNYGNLFLSHMARGLNSKKDRRSQLQRPRIHQRHQGQ